MKTYLTTGEAARLLGISTTRVRQLEAESKLRPVAKAGQNRLYDEADVHKFASHRVDREGSAPGR